MGTNGIIPGLCLCITLVVSGCATTDCATEAGKQSKWCSATYALGMNQTMEQHLDEKQSEADALEQEVIDALSQLSESEARLLETKDKLAAVKQSSEEAQALARKVSAELTIKRLDLKSKKKDLITVQNRLQSISQKTQKSEVDIAEIDRLKTELNETKSEITSIEDYIYKDLLVRAENAALFDL